MIAARALVFPTPPRLMVMDSPPVATPVAAVTRTRTVRVATPTGLLDAMLGVPPRPRALVLVVQGCVDAPCAEGNARLSDRLRQAGYATLELDMLLATERTAILGGAQRADVPTYTQRVLGAITWVDHHPLLAALPLVLLASGTCAAPALCAAAKRRDRVAAVMGRAARPELAGDALRQVRVPTYLLVADDDPTALAATRAAVALIPGGAEVRPIPAHGDLLRSPRAVGDSAGVLIEWVEGVLAR